MRQLKNSLFAGVAAAALLLGGCAVGTPAFSADDQASELQQEPNDSAEDEAEGADVPVTGDALQKASAAALEFLGEGQVTDTEVGDEEGYYEIEITLDNGSQVDVHLDENFNVLGQEADGADEND